MNRMAMHNPENESLATPEGQREHIIEQSGVDRNETTAARYERITCQDVQVGDRIARVRTDDFEAVTHITEGPKARRLWFGVPHYGRYGRFFPGNHNIRPRRDTKLWREVH